MLKLKIVLLLYIVQFLVRISMKSYEIKELLRSIKNLFKGDTKPQKDAEVAQNGHSVRKEGCGWGLVNVSCQPVRCCWVYFPSVSQSFTPHGYTKCRDKINKLQQQQSVVEKWLLISIPFCIKGKDIAVLQDLILSTLFFIQQHSLSALKQSPFFPSTESESNALQ